MKAPEHMKRAGKTCMRLIITAFMLTAAPLFADSSYHRLVRSQVLMDTVFTITVYCEKSEPAEAAVTEAFDGIRKIDSELGVYSENSEIFILNRKKTLKSPSEDLKTNVARSLYFSKLSDGAFDITVQPVLDLYAGSFGDNNAAPAGDMIENEVRKIDYKRIILKNDEIIIGDDQRITLGGIAKGYAVEKAVETLRHHGITMALIDAGGNMRALGKKPEGEWHVALADPRDFDNYITIIPLDNHAVATSGDYERYFDDEMTYHHIIDPKTGYSATELISATIVTDSAFDADALSTAVFVLGKKRGMALIESLPGVEGLIITREREISRSSGFKETFPTPAGEQAAGQLEIENR